MTNERRKKQLRKKLTSLIKKNFNDKDVCILVTFKDSDQKKSVEEAKKDACNYLRKLKRIARDYGWHNAEYTYSTKGKIRRSIGLEKVIKDKRIINFDRSSLRCNH